MEVFSPALQEFVATTLKKLKDFNPEIRYPYKNHPFAALTFNLGPAACTIPHKDLKDLGWGWCAVTSMGRYDHTKGGHLVLWDLNLAVEFPPNSTIFIPSAILRHSNTAVGPAEHRSSVTQYNSAGLFRWVAYEGSLKGEKKRSGKEWWDAPRHMFFVKGGSGQKMASTNTP